ncbi:hypothetical protein [Promicromonospora sp. NPDC050880]|uniref:hypothetical protein n=1 Tax=Promicromonospora sp. NPDC050880 TaxID=3364406 RepID=UPI00378BC842
MTATQEWHPDIRRDLVPGRSAWFWGQVWRVTGVAWIPLMTMTLFAAVYGSPAYVIVSLAVWGLCAVLFGVRNLGSPLTWLEGRQEQAERAAGYTTAVGTRVADEDLVDVDVVDPRSGRVIRLAGEHMPRAFFNDRAAFMRDRLRRVRAAGE